MLESIVGGAVGGILRSVPEILKVLDQRGERAHELALFDRQLEADKLRQQGGLALVEAQGQANLDAAGVLALTEALKGQARPSGIRWVDALNTSVRPVVTYWLMALYAAAKTMSLWLLAQAGVSNLALLEAVYTADDQAMLSGILSFWFVGRVWDKKR